MKPEIKEKWVSALRSGQYKQGRGRLCNGNEFCCMGVLCDLFVRECLEINPNIKFLWKKDYFTDRYILLGEAGVLPVEVVSWAGLHARNPYIKGEGELSRLNDNYGKTFIEIADLIEKNL